MSAKKSKRKAIKHSHHTKNKSAYPVLLRDHPRFFLGMGVMLMMVSVLLLTIGYVSDARIGLAMMSLFFGLGLVIVANAALPKKSKHN